MAELLAFMGVAVVVIVTPGQSGHRAHRAAYLTFLGRQALLSAARRRARADLAPPAAGGHELRQGLLSNLGNPKMAVFFSSLLPQFADSFPALLGPGDLLRPWVRVADYSSVPVEDGWDAGSARATSSGSTCR